MLLTSFKQNSFYGQVWLFIVLFKSFIWFFHNILQKDLNKLFGQPDISGSKKKKKSEDHGSHLSRDCIWLEEIKQWSIYDFFLIHGCLCRYEILWKQRTQGHTPCLWEAGQKDYIVQKRSLILFSAYHKSRSLKTASV